METEKIVDNLKERVSLLKKWIDCAEAEKVQDQYLAPKIKELNDVYAELRKHDPNFLP